MERTDQEVKDFVNKLKLLVMNNINSVFYEMLPLCGFGIAESFNLFLSYHKQICFASRLLVHAYIVDHKGIFGEKINDSLFERSMYLQSSIVAYSSCIDLIYQILYFYFELYDILDHKHIYSRDNIINISKKVRGGKIKEIDKWLNTDTRTHKFYIELVKYKEFLANLKDRANDIKHRGRFWVTGMELERYSKVTKQIEGVEYNISDIVKSRVFDIDAEIQYLTEVHQRTFEMEKTLYTFLDYKKCLQEFWKANGVNVIPPE